MNDGVDRAAVRCAWANTELLAGYHDREWGVPIHDDRRLFEHLVLGGAQAGLSWSTILKKREAYRTAFEEFNIDVVARFSDNHVQELLRNPGIVRNRAKVVATVNNAKAVLKIRDEFGSLDTYFWNFVNGVPVKNAHQTLADLPPTDPISDLMSADLYYRGFKFVGSTICYAFMQAVGMVNDHTVDCFRYNEV